MDAPPPDTEIIADADHSMISVTGAFPATINEGAGDDNSRPAIVVLQGMNFEKAASANLQVAITGWTGLQVLDKKIATDGDYIVLAVHVPVDTGCNAPTMRALSVTVSKSDGGSGMVSAPLPAGMLQVTCLDELTSAPTDSIDPPPLYSRIAITTPIAYTAAAGKKPAILRAVSSITIANGSNVAQPVDVNALADAPGPGGGAGGGSGSDGSGPGHGGAGGTPGGGGGAGFVAMGTMGTGGTLGTGGSAGAAQSPADPWIASYANNVSSGGGGGGEVGGGGGGTLELTAGGDLKVGNISANGAAGTSAGSGITVADGGGGGGTGGVIVLRAGGTIAAGAASVTGGGSGAGRLGGGTGGSGSAGRVRVDSALGALPTGTIQIGPMFTSAPTVTDTYPTLNLRGLHDDPSATVKIFDYKGELVPNMFNMTSYPVGFGSTAPIATASIVGPALKIGYNKVCVFVAGNTSPNVPEGANCIEIGYAP